MIPEGDMSLWFSGKEMHRGKLLADAVGKNEKTTMIVKIQKVRPRLFSTRVHVVVRALQKGNGAPARERVVSDDEQKQMMAYYYRKQQDLKVGSRDVCAF